MISKVKVKKELNAGSLLARLHRSFYASPQEGLLSLNDMQKLNLITMHLFYFFVEGDIEWVSLNVYSVT